LLKRNTCYNVVMEDDNAWENESNSEPGGSIAPISWTASEFVHHEKPAGWYGVVLGSGVFLAIVVFFLTGRGLSGIFASFVVILSVIAMLLVGKRQPRVLSYSIDEEGISIENKLYDFEMFSSFSVLDGPVNSILLMPLKRIAAPLTLYFSDEDADNIVDTLGEFLPHEDRKIDSVDRLMSKIRF
jgi:hypothetical protein